MTIKEKILTFLDAQGIKKTEFFEAVGLSPSNFKGTAKQGELGGDKIAKILTLYPNLSAEWLMRGEGSMLLQEANKETTEPINEPHISSEEAMAPGTEFVINRLLDKVDDANAIIRNVTEENGRLKERVVILERELAAARGGVSVHPMHSPVSELETAK